MWFRLRWLLLLLLLLVAGALRGRDLDAPFDREFEGWQGGFFAIAAHNVRELGLERTGIYPVLNAALPDQPRPSNYLIYSNHPPGIPLLNTLFVAVLGESEWALRLPHLLGSLAVVLLTYLLGLRVMGAAGTMIAVAMCATLPGLAFYGTLVNYENITLPLMMVVIWAHLRWSDKGRVRDALLFTLCLFTALSADWPAAFLLPVCILERLLPRGGQPLRRRLRASLFTFLAGTVAVALAYGLHQWLLSRSLAHLGLSRAEAMVQPTTARLQVLLEPFRSGGLGAWAAAQVTHISSLIQWDVFLVSLLGLVFCLLPFRRSERARIVILPGILAGIGYLLAFAKHSLDQPPFWIYTLPFLCLAFGFACFRTIALMLHGLWRRRLVAAAVVLPFLIFNVERWSALRERFRSDPPSRRIGAILRTSTPRHSILYVPRAAGWTLAYDYYAKRFITPITPEQALFAAPLAAYRDLDTKAEDLDGIADHALRILKLGYQGYAPIALLPTAPETEDIRRQAEAIEAVLRKHAPVREEHIESFRMLLTDPPDYEGEARYIHTLRSSPGVLVELRARLRARASLVPEADVIYTPQLREYPRIGPLRTEGKWFFFLPPNPARIAAMLHPLAGGEHARYLARLPRKLQGPCARALVLPAGQAQVTALLREIIPDLPPLETAGGFLFCAL